MSHIDDPAATAEMRKALGIKREDRVLINKASAWQVQYKGADWAAFVVAGTPAQAKTLFHDFFGKGYPEGKLEKVRCINQQNADGIEHGVLMPDDPRLATLGLRYLKREPEEGGAEA